MFYYNQIDFNQAQHKTIGFIFIGGFLDVCLYFDLFCIFLQYPWENNSHYWLYLGRSSLNVNFKQIRRPRNQISLEIILHQTVLNISILFSSATVWIRFFFFLSFPLAFDKRESVRVGFNSSCCCILCLRR